jgi:hypothetical protein
VNSQWKAKIQSIADKEEKILQKLLNYAPQPHLTGLMDNCSLCYKKTHRLHIRIVEDPEGLFEDGVKVCKKCAEKCGLSELLNEKSASYHGLTEAILRIRGEISLKNLSD